MKPELRIHARGLTELHLLEHSPRLTPEPALPKRKALALTELKSSASTSPRLVRSQIFRPHFLEPLMRMKREVLRPAKLHWPAVLDAHSIQLPAPQESSSPRSAGLSFPAPRPAFRLSPRSRESLRKSRPAALRSGRSPDQLSPDQLSA